MKQAPYERIDASPRFDGRIRNTHEMRYHLAAGFVREGDFVLDACCGSGYGKRILCRATEAYLGVDKAPPKGDDFRRVDFETGEGMEDWGPDIFVGLEGIEHLHDDGVQRFVAAALMATHTIVVSTPIIPNRNRYHKQQFREEEIPELFAVCDWQHFGTLHQNDHYGLFVFRR